MKEMFGNLGNDPKFNALAKLAFYSLFLIVAIILINTADIGDDSHKEEDNEQQLEGSMVLVMPDNYNYKYSISVDEKIYSYEGMVVDKVNTFKKNKDNEITNYKYEKNSYYQLEEEEYVETLKEEVYDIISYDYLNVDKFKDYLDNASRVDNKYYTYLKDTITGEETDIYILIELDENKVMIDYSKLVDEYDELIVVFEYKER